MKTFTRLKETFFGAVFLLPRKKDREEPKMTNVDTEKLLEVARRIREMREIVGLTVEEMAEKTEVTIDDYLKYEAGQLDFPFTFIHKCSLAFGIGITDLLEGQSAHLSSYTVTR